MKKQKTLHVRAINWLNEEHDLCEELKNELNNTGLQKNTPFKIDESHICLLHNYKIEKNYIVINIIEYEKDYNPPIIYLATGDVDTQAPPESSEFIHSQTTLCIDKNYIFGFRHIHRFTESHSAGLIRGLIKKLGCSEKLCDFELLKFANPKELHKILDNDSIAKVILPIGNFQQAANATSGFPSLFSLFSMSQSAKDGIQNSTMATDIVIKTGKSSRNQWDSETTVNLATNLVHQNDFSYKLVTKSGIVITDNNLVIKTYGNFVHNNGLVDFISSCAEFSAVRKQLAKIIESNQ